MKPAYKNWMPKGMIWSFAAGTAVALALTLIIGVNWLKILLLILTLVLAGVTVWTVLMYRAFSYDGKRQMSRQIIDGVADYVKLPEGGRCLDVGCGSGALANAVAKRNPQSTVTGIDRWGAEYASFSKKLCEDNAKAEGVAERTEFTQGNALKLDFPDGTFDAVTSNYVYHNIPSRDRQTILLETLRVLKKGGSFAIHDIFSKDKYGDMQAFVTKLEGLGYERAELIPTGNGKFMSAWEAKWMGLSGSALLVGKK
jgi:ubiquinone/menaquinone biosynthesis C-methylase UbiE